MTKYVKTKAELLALARKMQQFGGLGETQYRDQAAVIGWQETIHQHNHQISEPPITLDDEPVDGYDRNRAE